MADPTCHPAESKPAVVGFGTKAPSNFEELMEGVWRQNPTFVMVLGISYRYIYLFVGIVEDTYRAIKSRVGSAMHYRKGQRIVTWNMAYLWKRSYQLNEQVYNAMLSRGFRGEPVSLNHSRARLRDWLWLSGCAAAILALVYAELTIRK